MRSISLEDNRPSVPWGEAWADAGADGVPKYEGELAQALTAIDGKSLHELSKKFLIFPFESAKQDLVGRKKDEKVVFRLLKRDSETPSFQTGNVMGFFGLKNGVRVRIVSRFDSGNENGERRNFFLHYMLQKICNVAIAPETASADDELHEFLYYLFPAYLKEACKQGIFRAYVTREYNDANVRGPIDVSRHIRYNVPFNGKIAYHTREYTIDNPMTQLVRHTIEFIRGIEFGKKLLDEAVDKEVREDVESIEFATPSYSRNARWQVVARNLRPVTHPFYTAYEPLRKLCLAILRRDRLSHGDSEDEPIAGILFDGSALWEEYLAKVFEEGGLGLVHSNNRTGGGGIALFVGGKSVYYPDFYHPEQNKEPPAEDWALRGERAKRGIVLDAKYKRLCTVKGEEAEADNSEDEKKGNYTFHYCHDDLFQMLTYLHCLPANRAVLLSPYSCQTADGKAPEKAVIVEPDETRKVLGLGGEISIMGIPIWTGAETFDAFSNAMKAVEEALCTQVMALPEIAARAIKT